MEKSVIVCDKVAKTTGPYSCGMRVSIGETNVIFVSGQVSEDAEGRIVGKGDISLQTEQVFRNMQHVLESAGASLADVIKVTLFLRNMEDRDAVAEVRRRLFEGNVPASTLIEVSKLAHPDWLIEAEAIAVTARTV